MIKSYYFFKLIYYVTHLIDEGEKYSIDEITGIVEKENVLKWLEDNYPSPREFGDEGPSLDMSIFMEDNDNREVEIISMIKRYYEDCSYDEGVKNNGLCLLLSSLVRVIKEEYTIYEE